MINTGLYYYIRALLPLESSSTLSSTKKIPSRPSALPRLKVISFFFSPTLLSPLFLSFFFCPILDI